MTPKPKAVTAAEWEKLCMKFLHAEEKKNKELLRTMKRAVALLHDGNNAIGLLEMAYRCPKYSRAWNVHCELDAGHAGLCSNGGDGFSGYDPTKEER